MKKVLKIAIACSMLFALLLIVCPISVYAAISQSANHSTHITVEVIDSEWSDKNGNILTTLPLPEYVSAGENVNLEDGIYVKNTGVNAYARVKIQSKIDGVIASAFDYSINENWVKGKDDYYYYCNNSSGAVLFSNEINLVIEELSISRQFSNSDKEKELTLVLTLEVLDANSNEYVAGWQDNPPEEWFSIIEG